MIFFIFSLCYAVENTNPIRQELDDLLALERSFPGIIYKIVVDDLKEIRNDRHAHYLSLRSSKDTSSFPHLIHSNYRGYQTQYEREIEWGLKEQQRRKTYNQTNIPSDTAKKKVFSSLRPLGRGWEVGLQSNISDLIDVNGSSYDAFRNLPLKSQKTEESIIDIPQFIRTSSGFQTLIHKNERHLLEEIILQSFYRLHIKHKDLFSQKIIQWMVKIIDYITVVQHQNTVNEYDVFQELYGLYQSLLFVFTSYQNEFTKESYQKVMMNVHQKRLPETVLPYVQMNIATKSGMDAFSKALLALSKIERNNNSSINCIPCFDDPYSYEDPNVMGQQTERVYYEIENFSRMLGFSENQIITMPIYVTGITSARFPMDGEKSYIFQNNQNILSTVSRLDEDDKNNFRPLHNDKEALNQVVQNIEDSLKENPYAALIIDTTIQLPGLNNDIDEDKDPAFYLLKHLQKHIANGKLIVFLTKSHQKYAILGVQKMRSGNLTLICNDEWKKKLTTSLEALDDVFDVWKDEMQWITYLYSLNEGKFEQDFLRETSNNAEFLFSELLKRNLTKGGKLSGPMILSSARLNVPFNNMQTFGFSFTSNAGYCGQYSNRINAGLEPQNILLKMITGEDFLKGPQTPTLHDEMVYNNEHYRKEIEPQKTTHSTFYGKKYDSYKKKIPKILQDKQEIFKYIQEMQQKYSDPNNPVAQGLKIVLS